MNKTSHKFLSFFLAVVASLSIFAFPIFAFSDEDQGDATDYIPISVPVSTPDPIPNDVFVTYNPENTEPIHTPVPLPSVTPSRPPQSITPAGNLTLVDDIKGESAEENQFITVVTKNNNYFYIIIDRSKEGKETVYFLNQVDETDLLSLMDEEEAPPAACSCQEKCTVGAINTSCEVCAVNRKDCTGQEPEPTPSEKPKEEPGKKEVNKKGILIILLVAALVVGGVVYYLLKNRKNPADAKGNTDLDDYDYGDADDEDNDDEEI